MSKTLSAKYYQENQERLEKKPMKDMKIFLRKKKKNGCNMVMNVTKISDRMKKKHVEYRQKYYKVRKK